MADYLAILLAEMIAIYFSEENLRYIDYLSLYRYLYSFIAAARTYRRIIPFWQRVEFAFFIVVFIVIIAYFIVLFL